MVMDAEEDSTVINGVKPMASSKQVPDQIKDVRAWKASLQLAAAAMPVKDLSEFKG